MTDIPPTERRNPRSTRLGELTADEIVTLMDEEEFDTLAAVRAARPALARASQEVAARFENGGTTVLFGSGTSGRIALQEVAELPPTFGVSTDRFLAFAAGGPSIGPAAITRSEDDTDAAPRVLRAIGIGPQDAVIGIAASGTTPFVLAAVAAARSAGAWTCGIANNPRTPLLQRSDLPILLMTGPEILCGSTRLKAGTAQKLALNRITTTAMVCCGRVIQNHMVDVVVTIDKLRGRAVRIVADLGPVPASRARELLEQHAWSVRAAVEAARRDGPDRDLGG